MKIVPRPWLGLLAFAVYAVVVAVIQGTSGIPYPALGASAHNIWRSGVLSIVIGGLILAGLTTWWGWWRPALFEQRRTPHRWTIVAPLLVLLLALMNLAVTDWSRLSIGFVVAGLALGVAVGFGEEMASRGLLLVGLRGRLREVFVWILTCLLFGLLHGINILLGARVGDTVFQMVDAAMSGSLFYILRRVTGTLIWAMALHGFWDFTVFAMAASGRFNPLSFLELLFGALGVVFGFFATKNRPETEGQTPTSP